MKHYLPLFTIITFFIAACYHGPTEETAGKLIEDTPFIQDYSIKYYYEGAAILSEVHCDTEGHIQIISGDGLLKPSGGQFLYPGTLERDLSYIHMKDRVIISAAVCNGRIVYLSNRAVFSNDWSGRLYIEHGMSDAAIFAGGSDFHFLIAGVNKLKYLNDSLTVWEGATPEMTVKDIRFDEINNLFFITGETTICVFNPADNSLKQILELDDLTSCAIAGGKIYACTSDGYMTIDRITYEPSGVIMSKMPCPEITVAREIYGVMWFGTNKGAFSLNDSGSYSYYASERWLPSDRVTGISPGPGGSVLVLTDKGMSAINFEEITLEEKAGFYLRQVRDRHIRYGFNAGIDLAEKGRLSSGTLADSDNDGLWTSMYLAAETFRLAVTGSEDAKRNVTESLDAMERLYTINDIPGFPSRSFERRGYKNEDSPWRRASHPEWDWKSTTSSDEAIGHIFALSVVAELSGEHKLKQKAVELIDTLMSHILKNKLYLVDWDGNPTRWGRWNPEYVNSFPTMVGDRKLNSSNIIGMLQTAYKFTGKEKYRDTAFVLMQKHGYLDNLMRPMAEIGMAPDGSGELSSLLSEGWNHSDDEMYFLGYWGLYRYAFNDTLRAKYRDAIIDHLIAEAPEREGLWPIMASITGQTLPEITDAAWFLREYPLDLIDWKIINSERNDIEPLELNFRGQTIGSVLPPDELPIARHNSNRFNLDGGNNGMSEHSAGDIWLLPYWMGRYLRIIGEPVRITE